MSVRDDIPPISAAQTARSAALAPAGGAASGLPGTAPAGLIAPMRTLGPTLLRASGAAAGFGGRDVIAGIDLEVRAGETVAIVGRSGCGKTTLLHLLAGLALPSAGSVEAEPAALMPQRDGLMPWATARDNAALPLRVAGIPRREARRVADGQLAALGLADATGRPVAALSGGMRQRVALARTLLTGRKLLLLDEPLAAVDALTRSELHDLLLRHLATGGHGAVLVTHDLDEAVRLADRVLILRPPRSMVDTSSPSSATGTTNTTNTTSAMSAMSANAARPRAIPANRHIPSTLHPGPVLTGKVGDRLEHRGGDALRAALLTELAA